MTRSDDTVTTLLVAGGLLVLLLRPSTHAVTGAPTGIGLPLGPFPLGLPLGRPAVDPTAGGSLSPEASRLLTALKPTSRGMVSPSPPSIPVWAPPPAPPSNDSLDTAPTIPGTSIPLAPVAVVVGAAGAGLSDLHTAELLTGLAFKVTSVGGTVIKYLDLADLGSVLQVIGTVGLVVDMAFTILGDASDAQKAFDLALDAVMIAALWIPVYGWAIAIVVGIIKLLGDLFGFSHGLTHAQREALERQQYGERLAPMLADLGHAYSPREMIHVLIDWSSGYCGGTHEIAMMAQLHDPAGWSIGGASGGVVPLVSPACYQWAAVFAGTVYRGLPLSSTGLSVDEQALLLVQYGATDFAALAQVGIREDLQVVFEDAVTARVRQKIPTWQALLAEGATLDDLDAVAEEIRLTADLHDLAAFYGYETWQALLTPMLQPAWTDYYAAHAADGSLGGFALAHGYPTLRAWRTALFEPLWHTWTVWTQVMVGCATVIARTGALERLMFEQQLGSQGTP